ncbi:MAG: hypothetical protein ACRDFZ_08750 [Candidatus Limnocylindria bacterium]
MKVGEWEDIGRSRALLQRVLGELGAVELAAHVTIHADGERQRILVATDIGLLDYNYAVTAPGEATYELRGGMARWPSVRGMRLQSDAQWDDNSRTARSIWRLVAEEPKIELAAESTESDRAEVTALLDFARACFASLDR